MSLEDCLILVQHALAAAVLAASAYCNELCGGTYDGKRHKNSPWRSIFVTHCARSVAKSRFSGCGAGWFWVMERTTTLTAYCVLGFSEFFMKPLKFSVRSQQFHTYTLVVYCCSRARERQTSGVIREFAVLDSSKRS